MAVLDDRAVDLRAENAELRRRLDEALAQQQASAEILRLINAAPGDLAPVFDAILEKAMRLCGASFGGLWTFDGKLLHPAVLRGSPAMNEFYRAPYSPPPGGWSHRVVGGAEFVYVPDITADEGYRTRPTAKAVADFGGFRSIILVPLRKAGVVCGIVSLYAEEIDSFSDYQIALLQNFAAQAVIAMENARLLTETREALEQQTATAEVLGIINSSPGDLAPVFDAILEKAHRLCAATRGTLFLFDGETFRAAAMHGYPALPEASPPRAISVSEDPRLASFLAGERLIHIPDLIKLDDPIARAVAERGGVRTNLLLPLRRDGALLGVLSCNRNEVRPFSDKEIALLENFAAQAVIAMENARLLTETREALEQQTATAEVLGVINSSPGDLAPVFDAMLEKAMRLCEASGGALRSYDGSAFHAAAMRGVPEAFVDATQIVVPDPDLALGRIACGADIVQVPDLTDPKLSQANAQRRRELLDLGGIRTALWVALRKDDALLGVFVLYRDRVQPFTNKQVSLVENFAAQAVIAMENARLLTETREALAQQTATAEVLEVINSSIGDLKPVFSAILEKALRSCGADLGNLLTYDGECFEAVVGHYGLTWVGDRELRRGRFRPFAGGGLLDRLVAGEHFVHTEDVRTAVSYQRNPEFRELIDGGGYQSITHIALRKENRLLGAIVIFFKERTSLTEKQIALLQNFAAQAVIAMENARLLGELRQRTDEVAELNRGLEARVAEQVEELGRVGKLKRFLAPQLAELIVSQGDENILESHRREIVVVFCDLRGFTAFAETAEPEEVLDLLREYHAALGPLVGEFEGTLDHFSGDGIMVFFNDPVPCPDPAERAVNMAVAMRAAANELVAAWRRRGRDLGFGVGIAQGYATLGQIGFADRSDYTAIGTVCNLAARLCAEAKDGQILLARRVAAAVEGAVALEELGTLSLKGLAQPVVAFNVLADAAAASPKERGIRNAPAAGPLQRSIFRLLDGYYIRLREDGGTRLRMLSKPRPSLTLTYVIPLIPALCLNNSLGPVLDIG